ncbi:MAG TPA: hypothetical protein PKC21_09430 [Oligoflexia bacterium]|nr:hypothetical protein [Oligoflexia bacterium]HMR25558.1 hypothetical protein [Oligoflexia bacterium]
MINLISEYSNESKKEMASFSDIEAQRGEKPQAYYSYVEDFEPLATKRSGKIAISPKSQSEVK